MTAIQLNSKFKKLYTSDKRYFLLTGGRGSGKTFAVQDFLVRLLEEVGQGILYTRYTMTSVDTTIIPLFKIYLQHVSDLSRYETTKNKIINKETGSFILFSGIKANSKDQTGRLKTLPNITTWVVEEGEDFNDQKAFEDIDDSVRSKHLQNRIIWIMNPTTSEHFIYKKFFEESHKTEEVEEAGEWVDENGKKRKFEFQRSTHKNVCHIHTTYHTNIKNLDADKVQQWEDTKTANPKKYNHKYIGAWIDTVEGVIFTDWEEGAFNHSLPFAYGQDYGINKDETTLIKVAIDKKRKQIFVHEEFYATTLNGRKLGTNDIFNINIARIKERNNLIVADSQEARLIIDLQRMGLNIEPCEKGPGSVLAGVRALMDYKIIVTSESHNIKKELKHYCWHDKKGEVPIDAYNHAIDAIRYVFRKLISGLNPYLYF